MHTPMPSSGTPVQLTLLSWPDSTPEEGGKGRGKERKEDVKEPGGARRTLRQEKMYGVDERG